MNITVNQTGGLFKLIMEGEMTIPEAMELKTGLLENLGKCEKLELDLSGVNEIDTSGFQLLYLLKREADAMNKPFTILSSSSKVTTILQLYNMKEYFDAA